MVCDRRWKYVHAVGFRPMLFDLANDPRRIARPRRRSGLCRPSATGWRPRWPMGPAAVAAHDAVGGADPRHARQSAAARHLDRRVGRGGYSRGAVERVSGRGGASSYEIRSAATGPASRERRSSMRVASLAAAVSIARLHARCALPLPRRRSATSRSASSSPSRPAARATALARLIADKMRAALNRPVIVENRTGAAGRIGVQAVKTAAPDGNTLLLTPIAPMAVYPARLQSLGYDPIDDFEPIVADRDLRFRRRGRAAGSGRSRSRNWSAWLKANPAQANYGMPAAGSLPHFFGVLFGRAAGVDLASRSSIAARPRRSTDLVGGQIPMVFTTTTDLLRDAQGRAHPHPGDLRCAALAVPARRADLQGGRLRHPGRRLVRHVRAGQDARRYRRALQQGDRRGDRARRRSRERLLDFGLEPTGTTAAEFAAIQKADAALWAPAVKASGFTPEQ